LARRLPGLQVDGTVNKGSRLRKSDPPLRRRPPAPTPREKPHGLVSLLLALRKNPILTWSRQHYEQPIVLERTFLGRSAVVNDPAAIRRILIDNADNYRKDDLQKKLLSPALGNGLLTTGGDDWRAQRKRFAPLFTPRVVSSFTSAMTASAQFLADRWGQMGEGKCINVAAEMSRAMLDVLERTLFSDGVGRQPEEFMTAATHYFDTQGRIDPLDMLQLPSWIPRIGMLRARPALQFFPQVVDAVVARRRANASGTAQHDLVSVLIETTSDGDVMNEHDIAANVITFIGAGHETPANTLTWSLFLLSFDDEWRTRVETEVDREMPDGIFVEGTLDRFVATRALIEEAMRLYPPVAIISREAIAADVLAGQRIPAGTMVVIAPWVLHRHRTLWQDPDTFDPSRFLPGASDAIDRYAYLPFGAGPRVCIGSTFAMQEMIIMLATLARFFRLDVMPGHKVEPVHRITLRPEGGMPMMLRRRSNAIMPAVCERAAAE
jgi:cytochrome P450